MPIEPPDVAVVSDPAIVFAFVALFASALILALLFASPWLSRVPPPPARNADQPPVTEPGLEQQALQPRPPGVAVPWSTAPPEPPAPWHSRIDNGPG
jgi:hypothetical protein